MTVPAIRFRALLILLPAVAVGATFLLAVRIWVLGGRAPNIILISIDTCRADHLTCYGYPARTTPNIDEFARQAVLFSNTISPTPLTLPAHCSMLTGTIPPYHGVHDNINYQLPVSAVTLAERLREQGYGTAAVIGAVVLDSKTGIDQGF